MHANLEIVTDDPNKHSLVVATRILLNPFSQRLLIFLKENLLYLLQVNLKTQQ